MHKIGDEFHYMLECTFMYFDDTRKVYLPRNLQSQRDTVINSSDTETFLNGINIAR